MSSYRQPFQGDYPITQKFGEIITGITFQDKPHTGIDFACPAGTPILASSDGFVFYAGWKDSGYGNCVFIRHYDGMTTIYEHLLKDIPVTVGQHVRQGEVIGFSGSTGNSTGPHLHFEMRDEAGKAVDPALRLANVIDTDKPKSLKDADQLSENVVVSAPSGVRRFNEDWSYPYPSTYSFGQKLHFTGRTAKRPGYPYTYCEVYEEPKCFWVAVNDGETQILDSE